MKTPQPREPAWPGPHSGAGGTDGKGGCRPEQRLFWRPEARDTAGIGPGAGVLGQHRGGFQRILERRGSQRSLNPTVPSPLHTTQADVAHSAAPGGRPGHPVLARMDRSAVRICAGVLSRVSAETESQTESYADVSMPESGTAQTQAAHEGVGASVQTGPWASPPSALLLQPRDALLLNRACFPHTVRTWCGWGERSLAASSL